MNIKLILVFLIVCIHLTQGMLHGQSVNSQNYQEDVLTIDAIISAYYEVVSGPKGQQRDWERDNFIHDASARIWITGMNDSNAPFIQSMNLEEYHENSSGLVNTGFFEEEISRQVEQFGNIVKVWSTYEWRTEQNGPVGGRGINSIQLYYDGTRYWILSWTYDNERTGNKIPKKYLKDTFYDLQGDYLGQSTPSDIPALFAPNIISTGMHEHSSPAFTPDGKEVYWSVFFEFWGPQEILYMKQIKGIWTRPEVAPFSGQYKDGNPFISPDGNRLFFESMHPTYLNDTSKTDLDLWYVDRINDGWSEPIHLGNQINSPAHDRGASVSANGTLYFSSAREGGYGNADIYYSEFIDGKYAELHNMDDKINAHTYESWPYISPDESYILYEISDNSVTGEKGIHVSFKDNSGIWTSPIWLGDKINIGGQNRCPMVTPDGKYFFFVSNKKLLHSSFDKQLKYNEILQKSDSPGNGWGDVYWVDASIIMEIRANNK